MSSQKFYIFALALVGCVYSANAQSCTIQDCSLVEEWAVCARNPITPGRYFTFKSRCALDNHNCALPTTGTALEFVGNGTCRCTGDATSTAITLTTQECNTIKLSKCANRMEIEPLCAIIGINAYRSFSNLCQAQLYSCNNPSSTVFILTAPGNCVCAPEPPVTTPATETTTPSTTAATPTKICARQSNNFITYPSEEALAIHNALNNNNSYQLAGSGPCRCTNDASPAAFKPTLALCSATCTPTANSRHCIYAATPEREYRSFANDCAAIKYACQRPSTSFFLISSNTYCVTCGSETP